KCLSPLECQPSRNWAGISECPAKRLLRSKNLSSELTNENPMGAFPEVKRGACDLRLFQQSGQDALPRLCTSGTKMQAWQLPAAAAKSNLSLLLCTTRQIRISESPSGDGEAVRQPHRSSVGGCHNDAPPPLRRTSLSLA